MPVHPIHHSRRWYYVLWSSLLLLSCAALFLWERPARTEQAALQVNLHLGNAPGGLRVQGWAGPSAAWPGPGWSGEGAFGDVIARPDGTTNLPVVRLWIARRRWVRDYIHRGTWDLVVLKLTPPVGPPRFIALPCASDIRSGLLRPKYRLSLSIDASWQNLKLDTNGANRIL